MFWENTSSMNCGNVECIFATEDDIEVKECGICKCSYSTFIQCT